MTAVTFDTLKFVKTLEQADMPRNQASAIASAVQTSLTQTLAEQTETFASKHDVSELRKDTDSKFDLLRKDIAALEQRIDAKISALDAKIDAKIDAQGNKLIIRLSGVLIAIISVVGLMVRFWPQAG